MARRDNGIEARDWIYSNWPTGTLLVEKSTGQQIVLGVYRRYCEFWVMVYDGGRGAHRITITALNLKDKFIKVG